ncbi:MAG: hypothetical protein KIT08_00520 [Anaerolineales bacterium]|nr:MAG: hypothetical protein KIT08_00520 [Anaerolineales bacterium]
MPIWFIAPLGIVVAALAGLLVAWAFEELRPRCPEHLASGAGLCGPADADPTGLICSERSAAPDH